MDFVLRHIAAVPGYEKIGEIRHIAAIPVNHQN